jgi:hypothetical protein
MNEVPHTSINITDDPPPTYQWWRWPLVPLAAIVASVLANLIFHFVMWFGEGAYGGVHKDGWIYQYVFPCVAMGLSGFSWCYASAYVAPFGKVITSTIMATIAGTLLLLITGVTLLQPEMSTGDLIEGIAYSIATIAGSVVATVKVAEQERTA